MTKILYLDQNAWVALARGAWDKSSYPKEHAALQTVIGSLRSKAILIALSYANIYETSKINDASRRRHLAYVQATISKGRVFRGRRRIFAETLRAWLADNLSIPCDHPGPDWYLSDLWFEGAAELSCDQSSSEVPPKWIELVRQNPAGALFSFLTENDEQVRRDAVRAFSSNSTALIQAIEARRARLVGERLAVKKRVYAATQLIEELDFILSIGRQLGLHWCSVADIGRSLARRLPEEIPVLRTERELAVRLEDQDRFISENDLRDMAAFATVLPLADLVVGEKLFVNLARQARLGELYRTTLHTTIFELASDFR